MRRVIRKRIRRTEDGLDLAVDFNADIAVNVGRAGAETATGRPRGDEDAERAEAPARPAVNDHEGKGT